MIYFGVIYIFLSQRITKPISSTHQLYRENRHLWSVNTSNIIIRIPLIMLSYTQGKDDYDYSPPVEEPGRPFAHQDSRRGQPFTPHPGDEFGEPFIPRPGDEFGEPLEDYDDDLSAMHDMSSPMMRSRGGELFNFPDTDTSILSSLHNLDDSLNSYSDSTMGYAMGPVLKAMLGEWSMGDELLSKKRRKRKTSREQQNV